jgi:hypothetical protein
MIVILVLGRLRQDDQDFKASLDHTGNSKPDRVI